MPALSVSFKVHASSKYMDKNRGRLAFGKGADRMKARAAPPFQPKIRISPKPTPSFSSYH